MESCRWENTDCLNFPARCHLCVFEDFHYKPRNKPKKNRPVMKKDKRQGASFEMSNHNAVQQLIHDDVKTRLTPNSGAGYIKGDQQISGIINVMEELKTKTSEVTRGKKSFTIKKEWLDKLHREANEAEQEFWYLKFSFYEHDQDVYCITEQDIIMSMVKTMLEDRRNIKKHELDKEVAQKESLSLSAENAALMAKIELLEKRIEQLEFNQQGEE